MRRIVAVLGTVALAIGVFGVMPAQATHCTNTGTVPPGVNTSCSNPVTIAVIEGLGDVCTKADPALVGANPHCTYHTDPFYSGAVTSPPVEQGLYFPHYGPGAKGPFSFSAGPDTSPGGSGFCVSTVGSQADGCTFTSWGTL